MLRIMLRVLLGFVIALPLLAGDLRVGIGRIKITPEKPIFLSGYAARKKPSEGVKLDIWAKAMAFEDRKNGKVVIVTTDLIGMSRQISERIGAEVEKKYGLRRAQLMINSSHTHSGRGGLQVHCSRTPKWGDDNRSRGFVRAAWRYRLSAWGDRKPTQPSFEATMVKTEEGEGEAAGGGCGGHTDVECPAFPASGV